MKANIPYPPPRQYVWQVQQADLGGIVDVQQSGVTGHHGSQVGERTRSIEPALGVVGLGALEEMDH